MGFRALSFVHEVQGVEHCDLRHSDIRGVAGHESKVMLDGSGGKQSINYREGGFRGERLCRYPSPAIGDRLIN